MRYSALEPLSPVEAAGLAVDLIKFFALNGSPSYEEKRESLGLPALPSNTLQALRLGDFLRYHRELGRDLRPRMQQIRSLVRALEDAGFLTCHGDDETGWFGEGRRYLASAELTVRAAKGALWLGRALGVRHLAAQIGSSVAYITGKTPSGDCAVGSGCHVLEDTVLTCAHVVDDMKLDGTLSIAGSVCPIDAVKSDPKSDVAVITIKTGRKLANPDLCFRAPRLLERVLIAGYPTIPLSADPVLTYQTGEICGAIDRPVVGPKAVLFSAIARPGNSGGPVVSEEGQVVGMVTRTLERQRESHDQMEPLPFFAAVSPATIEESFARLAGGRVLPWEDYS